MKVMITADPFIPVPPLNYGGIERIIFFLVEGLITKNIDVTLVSHFESKSSARQISYGGEGFFAHLRHSITVSRAARWKPDVIHSFGRLAYLLPLLRSATPKIMSYQRDPTIKQVKRAHKLSNGTLSFTGCSNYITKQINPYAKAITIYNGVDTDAYTFSNSVSASAPLTFLGKIDPTKGVHNAIKIAQLSDRKLIIAGNVTKENKTYFEHAVKPNLNGNIEYVGPVNDQQKNEILGNSIAFLMPIEWNEPFGIVMAEALACGTPVVGFPLGSVPEIITPGQNGFLADTVEEIVRKLKDIQSIKRVTCRQVAEDKFSARSIVNDYINLYCKILEQQS